MTSELPLLSNINAIVFDVIGTLVDEETTFVLTSAAIALRCGIANTDDLRTEWVRLLDRKMGDVVDGTSMWRAHQELVSEAGREAVQKLGGTLTTEATEMLNGVDREYRAWLDVAAGMHSLAADRLVIGLSNGDLRSLAWLASRNNLSWHAVLSTADVKTFKPADAAYQYVARTVSIEPARTLFVAAHPWDLRAAANHGFRTAYVSRPHAEQPDTTDRFDLAVSDLVELSRML